MLGCMEIYRSLKSHGTCGPSHPLRAGHQNSCVHADLAGKLPSHLRVPASVALPFGTCERVLQDSSNKQAASALDCLQASLVRYLSIFRARPQSLGHLSLKSASASFSRQCASSSTERAQDKFGPL